MTFWVELRRRNVIKVGASYLILAWVIAQVASVFAPVLTLPSWVVPFVFFLLILGFPVALFFAWAYEVTPEGIKRTRHVPLAESVRHLTGQRLNYVLTALLALTVATMAADTYLLRDRAEAASTASVATTTSADNGAPLGLRNPLADASFQKLTIFEESELDAAISPDGRFVAFVSNRDGPYDAWLTQIGTGSFVNVTNGEIPYILNDAIRNVGFSATNEVALVAEPRDENGWATRTETYLKPITGGPLRRLLDAGVEAAWSWDGSRVVYHESGPGDPIYVAGRSGRDAKQIHISARGVHAHYLTWSPDGRFIYFVQGIPTDEMDIWRVSADGGVAEQMTFHNANVAYPAFVDERTLIYRLTSTDGSSGPSLYAIDVENPLPQRATIGVEHYLSVSSAVGGRRLVATVANPTSTVWRIPVAAETVDEAAAGRVDLPNVRPLSPRFGLDSIWYLSGDGGVNALWRQRDGQPPVEIWKADDGALVVAPALASNGQIALLAQREGRKRLYVMNPDGTNVRELADSIDVRDAPTWSPDARWLAVATGDRLIKLSVDGGPAVTLIEGLARIPSWSPDGRFILYSESIQGGPNYPVKAVTPDGEPFHLPVFSVRRSGDRYRVLPNGREIVYVTGDYGRQDFWLIDIDSGQRRQLTSLRPGLWMQGFDVSSDGTELIFDRVHENADVVLIELPEKTL